MGFNIVVEDLGGAEEGVFAVWLKEQGETVTAGEPIAEVMTDKVNVEIEAPAAGILTERQVDAEDNVTLGQVIGTISDAA